MKKKIINIVKKKVIRPRESDLQKIVKRVIREERLNELGGMIYWEKGGKVLISLI